MVMAKLGASTILGKASCRRERTEVRDRSGVSLIWVVATLLMGFLPSASGRSASRTGNLPRRSGEGVCGRRLLGVVDRLDQLGHGFVRGLDLTVDKLRDDVLVGIGDSRRRAIA